ncbi:hypothetical protein Salat_1664400, partial [Sesamum alatum]
HKQRKRGRLLKTQLSSLTATTAAPPSTVSLSLTTRRTSTRRVCAVEAPPQSSTARRPPSRSPRRRAQPPPHLTAAAFTPSTCSAAATTDLPLSHQQDPKLRRCPPSPLTTTLNRRLPPLTAATGCQPLQEKKPRRRIFFTDCTTGVPIPQSTRPEHFTTII